MKMRFRVSGTLLVMIFSLILNTSITNGKSLSAGEKFSRPSSSLFSSSSRALRSMARVYMAYGEYAKAQPLAERALAMAQRNGASDCEFAMCFIDLAMLYRNQDKLINAEKMCELGLEFQKTAICKSNIHLAYTLKTLSSIYQQQAKYHQAETTLNEAMNVMLDSYNANDKAMAPFFVDTAELNVAQGQLVEAESNYERAMALINSNYGPNHLYTINVLGNIANLYTLQERYLEAEKMIDRTVAMQEKIYGPDHHLMAPSWLTKAKVCQVRGDCAMAENLIRRALSAVEKTGNSTALAKLEQDVKQIRVWGKSIHQTQPQI